MDAKPSAEPTPAPAGDDDLRVGQRDAAGRRPSTRSATRTTRSRSASSGVNGSTAAGAGAGRLGGDRVRRHRQEQRRGVRRASSSRLPPHRIRVTSSGSPGLDRDAVGGQRHVEHGGGVGEHLVAALAPGRDDGRRRPAGRPCRRRCAPTRPVRRRRARRARPRGGATPCAPSPAAASRPPGPTSRASIDRPASPRARVSACSATSSARRRCSTENEQPSRPPPVRAACRRLPGRRRHPRRAPRPACPCPPARRAAPSRAATPGRSGVAVSSGLRPARMRPGTDG